MKKRQWTEAELEMLGDNLKAYLTGKAEFSFSGFRRSITCHNHGTKTVYSN